jgi:TolB protein
MVALALSVLAVSAGSTAAQTPEAGDGAIQVLVGPGAQRLEPMAIPDATCKGASSTACAAVSEVLRRDMTLSFIFTIIPSRSYLADASLEDLTEISWSDWSNVGARFLIKAEVKGPEPYTLRMRLYNVTNRQQITVRGQDASGVKERGLRGAVHRFCNGVLTAITGQSGVFDTRIAYAAKVKPGVKAIGMMDMDGANRTGYIGNGSINMLPSWGFGGLLYTSFLQGKPEIYFGKKRLSSDGGHYRKVAVSRDGSTMVASISYGGQSDLFLMSKSGEVIRNLTNSPADEVSPSFSPDGDKIAFVSSAAGAPQIYVMSIAGGGSRRVTHAGGYNYAPDWGVNGLIVFAGMDNGTSDIFTVDAGGSSINRLTQNQGSNKDPSWSPDGRYVAFVSRRAEGSGVYLMSANGRYQLLISKGGGRSNVAWER